MSDQLWPDERIHRDLFNCHTPRGYYRDDEQYISVFQAESIAQRMRDDLEQRIRELEAQSAQMQRREGVTQ